MTRGCGVQNLTILHRPNQPSKTAVFEGQQAASGHQVRSFTEEIKPTAQNGMLCKLGSPRTRETFQ